jgi:hypothetical protein
MALLGHAADASRNFPASDFRQFYGNVLPQAYCQSRTGGSMTRYHAAAIVTAANVLAWIGAYVFAVTA